MQRSTQEAATRLHAVHWCTPGPSSNVGLGRHHKEHSMIYWDLLYEEDLASLDLPLLANFVFSHCKTNFQGMPPMWATNVSHQWEPPMWATHTMTEMFLTRQGYPLAIPKDLSIMTSLKPRNDYIVFPQYFMRSFNNGNNYVKNWSYVFYVIFITMLNFTT